MEVQICLIFTKNNRYYVYTLIFISIEILLSYHSLVIVSSSSILGPVYDSGTIISLKLLIVIWSIASSTLIASASSFSLFSLAANLYFSSASLSPVRSVTYLLLSWK